MITRRGFEKRNRRPNTTLLMEELGELAKAVHKESGMKLSETTRRTELEEELADARTDRLVWPINWASICVRWSRQKTQEQQAGMEIVI